jgi:putative acetyltransferase
LSTLASPPLVIRQSESAADIDAARTLFVEYVEWLKVDLCFQGFADELATLPGAYARPRGRLLLARRGDRLAGCVALRPLKAPVAAADAPATGDPDLDYSCELKRLWVRPHCRGYGVGRQLTAAAIAAAREIGYRAMRLDTLADRMPEAVAMYRSFGFVECAPYYHNPLADALYLTLAL